MPQAAGGENRQLEIESVYFSGCRSKACLHRNAIDVDKVTGPGDAKFHHGDEALPAAHPALVSASLFRAQPCI
jgi:hypothetical protein